MTCKDCIHYEICKDDCESGYLFESENGNFCDDDCEHFKNKADFVEVVRCKKCRYGDVATFSKTKDGDEVVECYCNLKKRITDVDSYCPSGERKDEE